LLPLRLDSLWAYTISTGSILQALILSDRRLVQIPPILDMQHHTLMKMLTCQHLGHHMKPSRSIWSCPCQRNPRAITTIHYKSTEVHNQQSALQQIVVLQAHHQSTRNPSQSRCQASQDRISMSSTEPFSPWSRHPQLPLSCFVVHTLIHCPSK